MELNEILLTIQKDLSNIKKDILLATSNSGVSDKWLSRSQVMEFLNYGDTQMCTLEKSGELQVSKIGRRTFINKESLEKLLNKNLVK